MFCCVMQNMAWAPMDVHAGILCQYPRGNRVSCPRIDWGIVNRQSNTVTPRYVVFFEDIIDLLENGFGSATALPACCAHVQKSVNNLAVKHPDSEGVHFLTSCKVKV